MSYKAIFLALLLLSIPSCKAPQDEIYDSPYLHIKIVVPEDGCTQEHDCTCGVCPPYGPVE